MNHKTLAVLLVSLLCAIGTNYATAGGSISGYDTVLAANVQAGATANGAYLSIKSHTEEITGISTATVSTTNLVPAGCRVLYIVGRVTTTISGGGVTDADWGDGADVNRYNNGAVFPVLTAGDTVDDDHATADPMSWSSSIHDVTITFNGGVPSAGAVRITAFTLCPTAPGS